MSPQFTAPAALLLSRKSPVLIRSLHTEGGSMRSRSKVWSILAAVTLVGAVGSVGAAGATTEPPAGTEPAGTEPAGTEPAGTEPAGTEAVAATEPPVTAPERGDADLVIWTDDTRQPVVEAIAQPFADENGIVIAVQELEFGQIREQLSLTDRAARDPTSSSAPTTGSANSSPTASSSRSTSPASPTASRTSRSTASPTTGRPTACPTPWRTSPSCATPISSPRRRPRSRR